MSERPVRGLGCVLALVLAGGSTGADDDAKRPPEPRLHDVAVIGETAVLGRTGGIVTVDLAAPGRPREIGRVGMKATVERIAIDGERAWLAAGAYGFVPVDLGDPVRPRIGPRIDVEGKVRQVLPVSADRVLLAESRHGISVYDVADPARAQRRVSLSSRDEVRALALHDGLLATAEDQAGVRLFDVARVDTPRELAVVELAGARDVAFVDGLLLVAAGRRGVVLLDVSAPRSPRIVGEVPPARSALTVIPHGRLALVGCGSAGVQIVDPFPSDGPQAIKLVRLSSRFPAGRLAVAGDQVLVAADRGGLAVIDVADPDAPRVVFPRSRRIEVELP